MGIFLSVLVASVGAMDLINCLAYVSNRLTNGGGGPPMVDEDLERYRKLLREKIDDAPKGAIEGLTYAQDGVMYKDGYRVERFDDERLDQLNAKIRELEQRSQEKDQKLDLLLNVKLDELERKSVEREMEIEILRSRSVSRAGSQEPTTSRSVPSIVLDQNDSRQGSNRFRPIHREDDFRRTIKKRSVTSNVSEDRTDELDLLSQMEEEESRKMEDYVPLVYNREEYLDAGNKRHKISPIQELCQMHEEEHRHRIMEHSPEPNFGADVTRPWGDIQLAETKKHEKLAPQLALDIEEETRDSDGSMLDDNEGLAKAIEETHQWLKSPRNTFPDVSQPKQDLLSPGAFVPVRSRSESPEEEHPTLKRTRKKSDLTALLLEEERRSEAFSTVIIQTEESDSEGGRRTEFLQSKSPSPFVGPFLENERLQQSTGQLIPLVIDQPEERSVSQEYQQLSSSSLPVSPSRDATISPAPIASSGSPASPVSSIVDESVKDGLPYYRSGDERSVSSSAGAAAVAASESERNVSRDGSVSLASTTGSASLDLHVDLPRTPSPIQQLTNAAELEAVTPTDLVVGSGPGSADRQSPKSSPAPTGRRFRMRHRKVRSVTPIDFNQTFMDDFIEQRISVSPSELEDYINSLAEIKIEPPKPVTPNYFLPTTPMTSGIPSLIVTDEKGADARFHDSLHSKAFYGDHAVDPSRILNHRVSYVEWIKKFPENMTSHLELEDYDSDDEEVESIINGAQIEAPDSLKFPVNGPTYDTPSPEPLRDLPTSPEVPPSKSPAVHTEFPLNVVPAYTTPSPVSIISEVSDSESAPDLSSMALGSPLLNSTTSPNAHFTPITSPSLKSPTPETHSLSPRSIPRLYIPSRSPTASPIPMDMTPEEAIFDIGHMDGLIFETRSRSPTPASIVQLCPLSPEELAYDIGNLGGLILGPPSRSASPLPPSPTPGSSSASSSLQPGLSSSSSKTPSTDS